MAFPISFVPNLYLGYLCRLSAVWSSHHPDQDIHPLVLPKNILYTAISLANQRCWVSGHCLAVHQQFHGSFPVPSH